MNATHIFSTIALTTLLTACGAGQQDTSMPTQLAASVTSAPATPSTSGAMPAPDCAAEGCAGLRIIDGNAEAFRIDAMRRDTRS